MIITLIVIFQSHRDAWAEIQCGGIGCCCGKTINILTLQYTFITIMHALHYSLQFNGIESIEMLDFVIEGIFGIWIFHGHSNLSPPTDF